MLGLVLLQAAFAQVVTLEQYKPHDFPLRAQFEGNPFDTAVSGEFSGPQGFRLHVPGFYDGEGTWNVRFSPPVPGRWRMETHSANRGLNGKVVAFDAVPSRNANAHGVLKVDSEHPYHFRFQDGTRFFLMGYEADWLWGADMLDPERKLMHRLIDQIAARGFNYVLVNIYAHDTRWCPGKVNEHDFGPAPVYPWEGNNEKPDHSRLNPKFFQIYDGMMSALLDKGIVAHIMLKVYNKAVNWPGKGSREEARFFEYVAARYQAYPNVVWDFSKEAYNERDNTLQKNLIDLVRRADAYGHLTTAHDDDAYEWDQALNSNLDFRVDQQHVDWEQMIAFDRAHRRRPVVNSEFSYELGVEALPTHTNVNQVGWEEMLRRAWRIQMAGGYLVYYYNNTAWDIVKPDPEPPGHARWQILKETMTSLPWWRMNPAPEMAAGGSCLAEPGIVYACYVEPAANSRNRLVLNLTTLGGAARAEWINTWTGERLGAGMLDAGVAQLRHPKEFGKAPAVLVVRRQ